MVRRDGFSGPSSRRVSDETEDDERGGGGSPTAGGAGNGNGNGGGKRAVQQPRPVRPEASESQRPPKEKTLKAPPVPSSDAAFSPRRRKQIAMDEDEEGASLRVITGVVCVICLYVYSHSRIVLVFA